MTGQSKDTTERLILNIVFLGGGGGGGERMNLDTKGTWVVIHYNNS